MELGKQTEADENDDVELRQFTIKNMASAFQALEKAMVFFEEQDPNAQHFARVHRAVEDAVTCYRQIYDERRYLAKQSSILQFFKQASHSSASASEAAAVQFSSVECRKCCLGIGTSWCGFYSWFWFLSGFIYIMYGNQLFKLLTLNVCEGGKKRMGSPLPWQQGRWPWGLAHPPSQQ